MKKTKKTIAVNESSGAEKVEKIERSVKTPSKAASKPTPTAKAEAALGTAENEAVGAQSKAETAAAKGRVKTALAKKKKQTEKRLKREKKRAEKKAKADALAAKRKERAAQRKAAREEKIRERAHRKANKKRAVAKRKAEKKKDSQEKKKDEKGYGGWLAAVVSLGVVSLALATTVTVGALDMKDEKEGAMTGYKSTVYELTGIMEHVDDDLERVRVSASPAQQSRILTDLLVQTRLAELDLEKLPVAVEHTQNLTSFVNRTARECERLLAKLRRGEELSDGDFACLERLYTVHRSLVDEVTKLTDGLTDKDVSVYLKKGKGSVQKTLERLEGLTLEENGSSPRVRGERKSEPRTLEERPREKIDPTRATALCEAYFAEYPVQGFTCIGETVTPQYSAYNVQGYDDEGGSLFAEVSQRDGRLLRFDYYEDCAEETFDRENAQRIAESFLEKLGYEDLEVVRARENGTTTDFVYLYSTDGIVCYPDEVRVKVCRSRGVVSGFDGVEYVQNHRDRGALNAKITMQDAADKLHKNLEVEASRLCLVRAVRGECLAYEFLCTHGEEKFFVYVDADDGSELAILNADDLQRFL